MKSININSNKVSVPENWSDITLRKQLAVDRLSLEVPEYKSLAIIAGYCDLSIDEVKKLNIKHVKKILDQLAFVFEPLPRATITDFTYKGNKYFLVDTLLKGEFQDYLFIETELQNKKGKEYQALPIIISILAKRKDESLSDFNLEERAEHFLDLPITVANNIWFFFAVTTQLLNQDSHSLLKVKDQQIQQSITSMKHTLKNSVGGGLLIRWFKGVLIYYLTYLQKGWIQYYSFFRSEQPKQN